MRTASIHKTNIKKFSIRLIAPGIVENIVHENASLDVTDILNIKAVNEKLTEGRPYGVLVDSGMFATISKEARELSASAEFARNTIAKAIYVRSLGQRIVGQVYIRVNRPAIKTKVFDDRLTALAWLKEQLK